MSQKRQDELTLFEALSEVFVRLAEARALRLVRPSAMAKMVREMRVFYEHSPAALAALEDVAKAIEKMDPC